MNESNESIDSGREKLKELESENKYLFHGSPHQLDELEPRQAQSIPLGGKEMVNDGEPAVAASPLADIAIFRSLLNRTNIKDNYTSSFSYRNGDITFSTNNHSLFEIRNCIGCV